MNANRRSLSHLIKQNSKVHISAYDKIPFVKTLKKYLCTYTCTYVISGQLYFSTKNIRSWVITFEEITGDTSGGLGKGGQVLLS